MSTACIGDCAQHGQLCDLNPGHDGGHECPDCPGRKRTRWRAAIDAHVAAHRAAELVETTPDVD